MKTFKDIIHSGRVAVIRTDTLYGLVGDATRPQTVDRIYTIKNRDPLKPVIVLIGNYNQLSLFGIHPSNKIMNELKKLWPGKTSVILDAPNESISTHYLHKGTGGIAFRIPGDAELRALLIDVGPLVAPSANPEGLEPAATIDQAREYFKDTVDYYMDGGEVTDNKPSQIIALSEDVDVTIIRK